MRTEFVTPKEYADAALKLARELNATGTYRPEHFKKVMYTNRGDIGALSAFGPTEDGLERRNPVIVALGDSVTAGHFEFIGEPMANFAKIMAGLMTPEDKLEVIDARECYPEKFRYMLIDKYEQTSVSVVNAGIAGDTIYGMKARVHRDVVCHAPDLVLVNGSLNWGESCGDTECYKQGLRQLVKILKNETKADIVLMTPNMATPSPRDNPKSPLIERVEFIRSLAEEECVCLADAYKVWEEYAALGNPIEALLANGGNHPSVTGHEIFAHVLMQLMA